MTEIAAGQHTLIIDFWRTRDPIGRAWRWLLPDLRADSAAQDLLHLGWAAVTVGAVLFARRSAGRDRSPVATALPSVGAAQPAVGADR